MSGYAGVLLSRDVLNCRIRRRFSIQPRSSQSTKLSVALRLICVALMLLFGSPLSAQSQNENVIRAAFVFNLTKYIEWPQSSNQLAIGFIGDGPMGATLKDMLSGKSSESRPIQIFLSPSDEVLERCNLVYISYSSPKKIREALERIGNRSILTVGETGSFTRDGGMIGLVRVGEQMQIQVNMDATQAARLKVSSRLLNLSSVIRITGKN
jgi:hypothetical protein